VHHVLVQRWEDGTVGHLTQRAIIERDARFLGATAGFGGDVAKLDLGGILAGAGARSELVGVTLPDRRQHLDHHTVHQHTSGNTWSNIDFKAAVAGRARSAYTGLLRIEADAPNSEAYQENRNLLLSERARADTIPELEILTDEVSCSHGATVAPVDREQLFYLQTRGLPADTALRLVVRGFVEPTLCLVPAGLREELEALVDARLARLTGGR
jgi:Fe-S cluster assembly protein SufD